MGLLIKYLMMLLLLITINFHLTNKNFTEENIINESIEASFTDEIQYLGKTESSDRENNKEQVKYKFQYHDIQFSVVETKFISTQAIIQTSDFNLKLYEKYEDELNTINQTISPVYNGLRMEAKIEDFEQIQEIVCDFNKMIEIVSEDIPITQSDFIEHKYRLLINGEEVCEVSDQSNMEFNVKDYTDLLEMKYAYWIKQGESDIEYDKNIIDTIPSMYITDLYINGEKFVETQYPITFIYDLETQKYYTEISFGTKYETHSTTVIDWLQKDIIETYYDDCNYNVENNITTYTIDGETYEISNINGKFYSNGIEMETTTHINDMNIETQNHQWIDIENYAKLMHMTVTKINSNGIYLQTNHLY